MPKKSLKPPSPLPRPRGSIAVQFDQNGVPSLLDYDSDHQALKLRIRKRGRSGDLPKGTVCVVMDCREQSLTRTFNVEDAATYEADLKTWKAKRSEQSAAARQKRAAAAVPA